MAHDIKTVSVKLQLKVVSTENFFRLTLQLSVVVTSWANLKRVKDSTS